MGEWHSTHAQKVLVWFAFLQCLIHTVASARWATTVLDLVNRFNGFFAL
jgi:hypothetical protein